MAHRVCSCKGLYFLVIQTSVTPDARSSATRALDASFGDDWLLSKLGWEWKLLAAAPINDAPLPVVILNDKRAKTRYALEDGGAYLIRPDQYVAARWKRFDPKKLEAVRWFN